MVIFDIYSVLLFLSAAIVGSFAVVLYFGSRSLSTRAFIALLIATIGWTVVTELLRSSTNEAFIEFLGRANDIFGSLIGVTFFYFCLVFPEDDAKSPWIIPLFALYEIVLIVLTALGLVWYGHAFVGGIEGWDATLTPGPLWWLFDGPFAALILGGLFLLYRKYRKAGGIDRKNLGFMFWGLLLSGIPGSIIGVVIPSFFGYKYIDWASPFTALLTITIVAYSVARYRQMNVKAALAEVLVLVMTVLLFMNIFISEQILGVAGKVVLFGAFGGIGYLFIKSILKGEEQKEQLKDLNEHLNEKVDEQTHKLRELYESEKTSRIALEKANEDLKELDRRKSEFLSIMAHQLRTPLSGVKWGLNMLLGSKTETLTESQRKIVASLDAGNERMIGIVNRMLDADKINTGNFELTLEKTELVPLIEGVISDMQLVAKEHAATVTFTHRDSIPPLMLDREMTRFAVQNLLSNAIKYGRGKEIIFDAGVKDGNVVCTITDSGIGIPDNEKPYIFSRFFRAKNAIAVEPNGNGLGLYIVKSVIEKQGGAIRFESEENKGSTFHFSLPVP